jgi:hypothetical protein
METPSKADQFYEDLEMYNSFINDMGKLITIPFEASVALKVYAKHSPEITTENYKDKLTDQLFALLGLKELQPC